jgi:hypothetical protein
MEFRGMKKRYHSFDVQDGDLRKLLILCASRRCLRLPSGLFKFCCRFQVKVEDSILQALSPAFLTNPRLGTLSEYPPQTPC